MSDYWQRRNDEMKHIQAMYDTDAKYNKALIKLYDDTQNDIQKEIDSFMQRYAGKENISMDEARKRISDTDVEKLSSNAKKFVKEKDFSPRANEELRRYNLKMKTSRLELLNNNVRLNTIALADAEDRLLTARLSAEVVGEMTRQAGILGETVLSQTQMNRVAKSLVTADFKGATFSERVWRNQTELQAGLESSMRKVLINGQNPRRASIELRKLVKDDFKNKTYAAERIAITESARVQSGAQIESFKEFGVDKLEWVSELSACKICLPLDGKIFNVDTMYKQSVTIPAHSNCRCSYSAYVSREDFEADLKARGL